MGLVCGFPGKRGTERQLLVLREFKAHIDASGKGDPNLLVMAGYIAPAETWAEFSREWQIRLDQARLPYFKMSEMGARPEIAGYFYRVIEESGVTAAISCVFKTDDLVRAVRSIKWPPYVKNLEKLENPYYLAVQQIIGNLAENQASFGISEPIDFIFDEEAEKRHIIESWSRMKLAVPDDIRKLMGDTPIYRDDKKVLPLQAADLYAWWVRKWYLEGDMDGVKDLKFPWGAKRNIPRVHMVFEEADFRSFLSRIFTPKAIYVASLADPDAELARIEGD